VKKDKQKPTSEGESPHDPSKRSLLNKIWIGLGIFALIEFLALVIAFIRPGKMASRSDDSDTIIEAGPAKRFPHNSVTAFIRGKFYLCRMEDGGFLALSRKCTHLGCTVPWLEKEKRFSCPCHGSAFDIRGEVISPPAPRALDLYPVFIENNIVKVDTGKRMKRKGFEAKQLVYPKKV